MTSRKGPEELGLQAVTRVVWILSLEKCRQSYQLLSSIEGFLNAWNMQMLGNGSKSIGFPDIE